LCGILVLMGFGLQGLSADRERGYLSNVCVAPLMRQRGIGMALLQQAQNMSQLWGVTNLYVHAVATNEAAVKLYSKGGFTVVATSEAPVKLSSTGSFTLEKEAVITIARRQTRPSRLLLRKFI
jgi:ribosomal protein S18 acetylase RimI-like enzyme